MQTSLTSQYSVSNIFSSEKYLFLGDVLNCWSIDRLSLPHMADRKSSAGSCSATRIRLSPVGGGNSLSPGDYDTRRRLSAPCSTASNGSQVGHLRGNILIDIIMIRNWYFPSKFLASEEPPTTILFFALQSLQGALLTVYPPTLPIYNLFLIRKGRCLCLTRHFEGNCSFRNFNFLGFFTNYLILNNNKNMFFSWFSI